MHRMVTGGSTEATLAFVVSRVDREGPRPPSFEEFSALAEDAMEHLLDDPRAIDPIVTGQGRSACLEMTFTMPTSNATSRSTAHEIVRDLTAKLGVELRDSSPANGSLAAPPADPPTIVLHWQSQRFDHSAESAPEPARA